MNSILNLNSPLIGLSPMDGITDSPFRYITKKYGNPDLIFTEFNNVMGMCLAGDNVMNTFEYDETQRPIIGQIFGKEPQYFYHAAKILCALGFDGVDINMGCPAKTVASSGSGAGLIRTPELAKEIVLATKEGVAHWVSNGELTGLKERSLKGVNLLLERKKREIERNEFNLEKISNGFKNLLSSIKKEKTIERNLIPVSVKTRIGYDKPITELWITQINEVNPMWITLHGRTLKQMYTGFADWNEIKIAVNNSKAPILANGDIKNKEDIEKVLRLTGASGVLIGRATYGNPWIFKTLKDNNEIDLKKRINVMLEHAEKFVELNPEPKLFFQMRKHFGWYIKGFDGANDIRKKLMTSTSLPEVRKIIEEYL